MTRLLAVALLSSLALSGCATIRRSSSSGYADAQGAHAREGADLSGEDLETMNKKKRVRQLEARLETQREKEQYSKILPWLSGDDEKIEFLQIGSIESRQAWINSHDIWRRSQTSSAETKELVDAGDIAVGMAMDHVRKSWGEPQAVEVSGNPLYHNERWKYVKFLSSANGYRQEKRFVYFEGGRVVGWETE